MGCHGINHTQYSSRNSSPKRDRRLLSAALFGKSAALESHDMAIVAVKRENVAVAGQTTALFSGVPPRGTECGRNSTIR
jgi:hypothetical protein